MTTKQKYDYVITSLVDNPDYVPTAIIDTFLPDFAADDSKIEPTKRGSLISFKLKDGASDEDMDEYVRFVLNYVNEPELFDKPGSEKSLPGFGAKK